MDNSVKLETIDGKCKNCGSNLKFSPKDKALLCDKCGTTEDLQITKENTKLPCALANDSDLAEWNALTKHIKCKSCGSQIDLTGNEISIRCPYCDSQNIVLPNEVKGLYPNNIAFFEFSKEDALVKFQEQAKKRFMAPRPFKKLLPESMVDAYYFPSFDFDANSSATYQGRLYRHETRGAGKNAHTVTVHFNISGKIDLKHRDVLVEASSRLNQHQLDEILPYKYDKLCDFNPRSLFGYNVEQYNENFSLLHKRARDIFEDQLRTAILKKYSYDGVSYLNIDAVYKDELYAYCMMPIYSFEFEYKEKKYNPVMNGQTGKLGGGLPISKLKVAFGVGLLVLFIIGIILLMVFGGE